MRTKQEKALNDYINLKHNQAECTGFIDGYDAGIKDADEFACGFAEWIANNQFSYYNEKWTSTKMYYGGCIYTTKELLEIYKQQNNGK